MNKDRDGYLSQKFNIILAVLLVCLFLFLGYVTIKEDPSDHIRIAFVGGIAVAIVLEWFLIRVISNRRNKKNDE